MIGNDIVDLAQARRDSNWQRKGFLNKLFTTHEQQLIRTAHDPDAMVWTLWSMKESAYKLVVRNTGRCFFAPRQFVCQVNTSLSITTQGSVFYQCFYKTTSCITDRYVTSVAFPVDTVQPGSQVIIRFDQVGYQHQHQTIRQAVKQHCAASWSLSENQIQLHKDALGVPTLVVNRPSEAPVYKPISLSHHGHYGAFVL